jgi:hypothetical protein
LTSIHVECTDDYRSAINTADLLCDWSINNHRLLNITSTYTKNPDSQKSNKYPPGTMTKLNQRNKQNHDACELGCLTFFMIWKFRKGESVLGKHFEKNLILKILAILRNDFYLNFN